MTPECHLEIEADGKVLRVNADDCDKFEFGTPREVVEQTDTTEGRIERKLNSHGRLLVDITFKDGKFPSWIDKESRA